jgi:hypothetical protein
MSIDIVGYMTTIRKDVLLGHRGDPPKLKPFVGRWFDTSSLAFPLVLGIDANAPTRVFNGARTNEVSAINDG